MINPFFSPLGGSRRQFTQPQNQFTQQNQYDFSGWGDRLDKIEQGIAGLTDQFNNFQTPGDVAPEYTGNAAPEPLEQTTNAPEPLGGIESLAPPQNAGFNFDPSGGSLFSQLSTAYGQPSTMQAQFNQENPNAVSQSGGPMYLRGGGNYTQGFQDFVHDQGYYVDPTKSYLDGGMDISETPIDLPFRGPRQENIPQTDAGWGPKPNTNFQPHTGIPVPNQEWLAGLGPLRPNDIANISEVTRPGIHNIHDTGLLPGAPSGAQLGLPQLDKTWSPTPGWRPEQGTPPPQQAMDAHADFWRSKGLQSPGGAYTGSPEQRIALTNSLGGRPNDMAMPIGGLTQPQQQQALQVGLGALQGPTQQKIQQGIGALV